MLSTTWETDEVSIKLVNTVGHLAGKEADIFPKELVETKLVECFLVQTL